jgi:hypothetical protein
MENKNNLWFRDIKEKNLLIDENVIRARAGFLILLPIFMAFTFFHFNSMFTTQWIVDATSANSDMMDTDSLNRQLYTIEAVKRTYDYTIQTSLLFLALFELLMGMSRYTSKFSPTIILATLAMKKREPVYTPYGPKKFAWGFGSLLISSCIIFFNPEWIPIEDFLIPIETALVILGICAIFIWLELSFGLCMGCKLHALCIKLGILKNECIECNNLDLSSNKKD